MTEPLDDPELWRVDALLTSCLSSRWLRASNTSVAWLCPSLDDCVAADLLQWGRASQRAPYFV